MKGKCQKGPRRARLFPLSNSLLFLATSGLNTVCSLLFPNFRSTTFQFQQEWVDDRHARFSPGSWGDQSKDFFRSVRWGSVNHSPKAHAIISFSHKNCRTGKKKLQSYHYSNPCKSQAIKFKCCHLLN